MSGSIAVELWRDLQPGETDAAVCQHAVRSAQRQGVHRATRRFVDGARPDVEALNPTTPLNYRAGWGYLLLTWGLWNQGNGTYTLYAFAFDPEGHVATIGQKTIVVEQQRRRPSRSDRSTRRRSAARRAARP